MAGTPDGDAVTSWRDKAACQAAPGLFFGPEGEDAHTKRYREAAAIAICRECPVIRACFTYAIRRPERYGVYGGTGERERSYMRRNYLRTARGAR